MPEHHPFIDALCEPFDSREVKFRPGAVSGSRAMALAYVDARVIQDRLDQVLGVTGWQDEYECLAGGSVVCRLRLRLGDEWITKMDVGSPSEQPDAGDQLKAAFSDALKRAAIKFGIGRYLYRLPQQWCDYDAKKRQFARTPTLPAWALPAGGKNTPPAPASAPPRQTPAPSKKATQPPLERPRSEDMDPSELIDPTMAKYLFDLAASLGFSPEQLDKATALRFGGARVEEMSVAQWHQAIALLEKNQRRAS